MKKVLPDFRCHGGDRKFIPLTSRDGLVDSHTENFIEALEEIAGPLSSRLVLDLGCGRGDLVYALRKRGVRAFGTEVDERFVDSGSILQELFHDDYKILSTINKNGQSVFPDSYFDLIISDQVLEHVADLSSVAAEISRVCKLGAQTVHQFPAKYVPVEPHFHMPFVHWLPKNRIRQFAIYFMLRAGFARKYFSGYSYADRTNVIYTYSCEETFYRSPSEICRVFREYGFVSCSSVFLSARVKKRFGYQVPLLPLLIGTFRNAIYAGTKSFD